MEGVGARPRCRGDHAASGAAELGRESVGDNAELLHAFERRRVVEIVGRAVALLGAVEHHRRRVRPCTVDERSGAGVSSIDDAGSERDQRVRIAADERQLDHLASGHDIADRGALQLQLHGIGGDGDFGLQRSRLERQIHSGRQADANHHASHAGAAEPGQRRGDLVDPDGQIGDRVLPHTVRERLPNHTGAGLGDDHAGAGHHAARLVEDAAGNGALFDLRVDDSRRMRQQEQRQAFTTEDIFPPVLGVLRGAIRITWTDS